MGAEESKSPGSSSSCPSFASAAVDFPNSCKKEADARPWTLLHQCTLDKWKEGHAEGAGFLETTLACDGVVHTDCSTSFCINRQGIININKGSSIFSFRKRSRFDKMAEHFEYNHIPAQMSSINHFRVKSVLCYRETQVVLHLTRNHNSQFGLLDLRINKFIGVFGKQQVEFVNEQLEGAVTPDMTRCLIRIPSPTAQPPPRRGQRANQMPPGVFQLYDLKTKKLLSECDIHFGMCHFAFDPRFLGNRLAVTNFEPNQTNSLSTVRMDTWSVLATNNRVTDTRTALYPAMRDLRYTRDGTLIMASILDAQCFCREKRTRGNYQPINASIYVFTSDTLSTLHCIEYVRYTCTQHLCPINYTPVLSACGARMGVVMNVADNPTTHFVNVFKLPQVSGSLQSMCRVVIRQSFVTDMLPQLPLPPKLINYLHFKPEFDY